ncbi:carbohydrate esterase family 16 protein [Guyanagaster necrorhizus]|uniref:Carbohydrate esterase family 16 protein n=1 Tax=Guyanagaster necrorhizus TaxID=856835 RepID=A0A9P7W5J6_9AGAR|nr:carbohydrate esterase family 16 protein [Guyanagaster necrorhizus MCA 3950]KAG7452340.1 carbohydrate esterase family 16 protein [Guyanagaster necrorhizus MCA 3950]
MSFLIFLFLPLLSVALQVKNLVTFGDSYTDIVNVGDGGTAWPVYAAGYADLTLYPFARSGATCSNNITFRPFPSIFESQLPLYFAEKHNGSIKVNPTETLYTQWIGTNDVGVYSLLTGSNDASLVDVVGCMVNWVRVLYEDGARNFLVQNMVPLNKVILYAPDSYPNRYFNGARNTSEWSVFMRELVLSGNSLSRAMLQALVPEVPGAHIGIFDSHGLFQDIYDNPAEYLNGTAPLNITGAVVSCVYTEGGGSSVCTTAEGTDRDSFLWYDELHPSEQADRIVARNIGSVARGEDNRWTTWIS